MASSSQPAVAPHVFELVVRLAAVATEEELATERNGLEKVQEIEAVPNVSRTCSEHLKLEAESV